MGRASRLGAQRVQERSATDGRYVRCPRILREDVAEMFADVGEILSAGHEPRDVALWLARVVWMQQKDQSCLDASYVLSAALDLVGISNTVVPVSVMIDDRREGTLRFCGRASLALFKTLHERHGGDYTAEQMDALEYEGDTDDEFWGDGGHAVVVCDGLGLVLDTTFDQFGVTALPYIFAAWLPEPDGDRARHYDGKTFTVRYVDVDDALVVADAHRWLASLAAVELVALAGHTAFDRQVSHTGGFDVFPSIQLLDTATDEMDVSPDGSSATLDAYRAQRTRWLAMLGHHEPVPVVWGISAPTSEAAPVAGADTTGTDEQGRES